MKAWIRHRTVDTFLAQLPLGPLLIRFRDMKRQAIFTEGIQVGIDIGYRKARMERGDQS